MCGRYVTAEESAIEREWNLTGPASERWQRDLFANYNTSPTQQVPIIRNVVRVDEGGERELVPMRWGLVPHFAKGVAGPYATFNARIETVRTAASYRGPWKRGQRCLIPAAGFYEWQAQPPDWQKTVPHYITVIDQPEAFAMAGLWDESVTTDGEVVLSCTIITMPANELMREIHNSKRAGSRRVLLDEKDRRMPAILSREACGVWLGGAEVDASAVLQPYPSELMRARPVRGVLRADQPPELAA